MPINRRSFTSSAAMASLLLQAESLAAMQPSTPVASPASTGFPLASERLTAMLAMAPADPLESFFNFTWTDLERQLEAFPTLEPEEVAMWLPAGTMVDAPFRYHGLEHYIGYSFIQIRQQLHLGRSPLPVRLLRLDANAEDLIAAWGKTGFEQMDRGFGPFWSLGVDGEIDEDNDLQYRMNGEFNNIAILEDDLIAIAPTADGLRDAVEAHQNQSFDLAAKIEPIHTYILDDAISLWCIEGAFLVIDDIVYPDVRISDALDKSDAAVGPMPVIKMVATSLTAGASSDFDIHQPQARASVFLKSTEANQADQIASVVEWRSANLTGLIPNSGSYADAYSALEIGIVNDDLVRVTSTGYVDQNFQFANMINRREALPFTFRLEEQP